MARTELVTEAIHLGSVFNISYKSVVIGILLQPTALYAGVKQLRPWFVLGWVTILVCQFLLIVLRMRPKLRSPGAALAATV